VICFYTFKWCSTSKKQTKLGALGAKLIASAGRMLGIPGLKVHNCNVLPSILLVHDSYKKTVIPERP